jgi:enoyl-CoA hydratase/carnithine racemase
MPEVSVHYYPDVLVSWYLTRIPNNIGTYLGLTGCSLNYLELFYCKLAQYFCSKNDVNSLIHELTNHNFENKNDNALLKTQLSKVFEKYHYKLSNNDNLKVKIANEIVKFEPMINQCFKYNTLEMILDALRNESSKNMAHANNNAIGQWCLKTYDQLMNLSPLSLKLTLRLLAVAKHETIAEHAQTCFKVGTKLLTIENFCKGIIYRLGPNKDRSGKKPKETYPYGITHENMSLLSNVINAIFDTNANNLFELRVVKDEQGHTIIAFVNQRIDASMPPALKVDDIVTHHKL